MKYTEAAKRQSKHVCVFGEPKSGKSTLTSKLALAGYKLQWISLDGGHTVIDKLPVEAQERIELFHLPDSQEYPIATETVPKMFTGKKIIFCVMHGKEGCSVCKSNSLPFDTVEFSALGLDTIVVLDTGSHFARSVQFKLGIGDDKVRSGDEAFKEYKQLAWMMDKVLTQIQNARYNVVTMFHVIEGVMEDNSKRLFPLMGSKNYSTTVGGFFDDVVYCETFNKKHAFGSSSTYKASVCTGSRTDIHIEEMKEPSLVPFFKTPPAPTQVEASGVVMALETAKANLNNPPTSQATAASELLAKLRK